MDDNTCRLFDYSQIVVLKIDLERHLLRCQWRRIEDTKIDLNRFSAADFVARFFVTAFDIDGAGAIEQLDLGSGEVLEALREEDIEAEASVVRFCEEFHFA